MNDSDIYSKQGVKNELKTRSKEKKDPIVIAGSVRCMYSYSTIGSIRIEKQKRRRFIDESESDISDEKEPILLLNELVDKESTVSR